MLVRQALQLVQVDEDFERTGDCAPMDDPVALDMRARRPGDLRVFQVRAEVTSDDARAPST